MVGWKQKEVYMLKIKRSEIPKSIEAKIVPVCILNGEDISNTNQAVKDLGI